MLKDKDGNRLFRKLTIRVIFPDNVFPPKTVVQHAGPHQGFGPTGIDDSLMRLAEHLDQMYPYWDFTPVELAPEGRTARFVLKFSGYKSSNRVAQPVFPDSKTDSQPQKSTALEPEAVKEEIQIERVINNPALVNMPSEVGNSL